MMSTMSSLSRTSLKVTRQSLNNPDEALSFSHCHASLFLDTGVFICTTCGFHNSHKDKVLSHIKEQRRWEERFHEIRLL